MEHVLSAVLFVVVAVVFLSVPFCIGRGWEKQFGNARKLNVASLDELRTELRSILDEGWTEQQLIDWKEAVGEAVGEAIARQNCDPENPDATKSNAESALNELSILIELTERVLKLEEADVSDFLNISGFPHHRFRTALEYWQDLESKIAKLEGAADEFHGRLSKIEDRLSPTVATAVAPPDDLWQEYARKASDAVQEKIPASTLPDDEEVLPGVTRRELNESNAAWKLFGQLLRDARLASGVSVPKTIDHFNAISYETGGWLPFPEMLDALIATYRPDAVLERQIRDAWAIAQKPYLGRVQGNSVTKPVPPPTVCISESTGKERCDPIIDLIEQAFAKWDWGEFGDPNFVKTKPVDRLGFVLEKLRTRAGLSAKDAKRIGVSSWERLSQIENFSSVPTDNELSLMLNAYSPPSHLVSRIWRLWGECGQAANQEL